MPTLRAALLPLLAAAALLGACGSATDPAVPADAASLQLQPFPEAVARYLHTGVSDRRRTVIRDEAAWAQFWAEVTSGYQPRPATPAIDFATEMVVVAAMGTRPSGGYSIAIDRAYEADGRLYAVVREVAPAPGCGTTGALSAPMAAVRVPRRDAPAAFVERAETRSCGG